ncbi:hypothetical protein [Agaribacter marinus]|uniref:Uncharacterized protein n=1 Tax=Agaribacter marinus TaxID=1431249 RepID=A0AA37T2F9_9ALTE|nr:hypothetical protein [Agaribacter marinus]GLR70420.1 hypothetical protein GCM10007852_13280 [Agaribacter marinus]
MSKVISLLPGEQPMPKAPKIAIDDALNCIPQHYLTYQHDVSSVQHIASFLDFDPAYLFFVDQDNAGIFIQIGIIGADNYTPYNEQEPKIVYGRKWRIESNQPSSEVIQTAFLAVQKAREHEIRELIKWRYNDVVTTPFSCHHDLPLMAMSKNTHVESQHEALSECELESLLFQIRYDFACFRLINVVTLSNGESIVEVKLTPAKNSHLPELIKPIQLNVMCESLSVDNFLYALVDSIISLSNKMVEENFTFKGFPRFSRANSIVSIAELSAKTRHLGHMSMIDGFENTLTMANYETDLARVPAMPNGVLGDKIKSQMSAFKITKGIMPLTDKT